MSSRRSWLVALAAGSLLAAALISPSGAATKAQRQAWKFVKKKLSATSTINAAGNPVDWTQLKNVPGGIADGTDASAQGSCTVGDFVIGIEADGDVVCDTPAGAGDITGVTAGNGLSGGGTSGDVALSVDPSEVQSRLQTACAAGSMIRSVDQAGAVTCSVDDGSNREVVVTQYLASGGQTQTGGTAVCPVGKAPVGGGGDVNLGPEDGGTTGVSIQDSYPSGNGWAAFAIETTANPFPWALDVYVICVTTE